MHSSLRLVQTSSYYNSFPYDILYKNIELDQVTNSTYK